MGCGCSKFSTVAEGGTGVQGHDLIISQAEQEKLYEEAFLEEERTRASRARLWVMAQPEVPQEEIESAIGQLCEWLTREMDDVIMSYVNPKQPKMPRRAPSVDAGGVRAMLPAPVQLDEDSSMMPLTTTLPPLITGSGSSPSNTTNQNPNSPVSIETNPSKTKEPLAPVPPPKEIEEEDGDDPEAVAEWRLMAMLKVMNKELWEDYTAKYDAVKASKANPVPVESSIQVPGGGTRTLQPFLSRQVSKYAISGVTGEEIEQRHIAIKELEERSASSDSSGGMKQHELDTISEESVTASLGAEEMRALKKLKVCIGEKDRKNLRNQFDMMDSEHSRISMNDFLYACHAIGTGLLPNEITKVYRLIDTDGRGSLGVEFDEFINRLHMYTRNISIHDDELNFEAPQRKRKVSSVPSLPVMLGAELRALSFNKLKMQHEQTSSMPDVTAGLNMKKSDASETNSEISSEEPASQQAPTSPAPDPKSLSKAERAEQKKKKQSKQPERELSGAERKNYALNRSGSVKIVVLGNQSTAKSGDNSSIKKAMSQKILQINGAKAANREKAQKLNAAAAEKEEAMRTTSDKTLDKTFKTSDKKEKNPLFEPLPAQVEQFVVKANKRIQEEERRASLLVDPGAAADRAVSGGAGGGHNPCKSCDTWDREASFLTRGKCEGIQD
eukprot:CAMPEP_0172004680 /NCGR_PEP_ID=MMETSP1041-20130122/4614_1 /TAXON_ID=464988 /ORGANISM="Hemiselmis andersenii, Strain CCMP439" /LENGTH=669 /DNA_ID=CAMNT_0012658567 /DNA_START=55 /DNA_END=2064 /DNA_ORIENTATION=+